MEESSVGKNWTPAELVDLTQPPKNLADLPDKSNHRQILAWAYPRIIIRLSIMARDANSWLD